MPQTVKFPPTNELMMAVPPTFKDWTATQQQQFSIFNSATHHSTHHSITPTNSTLPLITTLPTVLHDELVGLTFKADWDTQEEVSVMIVDNLSINSTMDDVITEGDVLLELAADSDMSEYKYLIQKRSGGHFTLKWDKFKRMSISNLTRIKNVDEDYIIVIRKIV